jgi:hypothetical protein
MLRMTRRRRYLRALIATLLLGVGVGVGVGGSAWAHPSATSTLHVGCEQIVGSAASPRGFIAGRRLMGRVVVPPARLQRAATSTTLAGRTFQRRGSRSELGQAG